MVVVRRWRHGEPPSHDKQSDFPSPQFIRDTMEDGVQSMLDGKIYTSKAALRQTYRAAGVTEVGNDPARLKPKAREVQKPDRHKIKETVEKAAARFNRGERVTK